MTILVVEDNPDFRKGAEKYFAGISEYVAWAGNFVDAKRYLSTATGAIIDCFFPYSFGTKDPQLVKAGREKAEKAMIDMMIYNERSLDPAVNAMIKGVKTAGLGMLRPISSNIPESHARTAARQYRAMLEAAIESDTNYPLGIVLAEEAEQMGIPFVLATSTHHHDNNTQKVADYANRNGWTLVDCDRDNPDEKKTPEFWARAYEALKRRYAR